MKSSAANTALYSGLKQEPGSGRTRSRCVAASIGPKNPLRCRISSVHHPPPGFYSYFRVFTGRNGPSVPPERSSLPVEIQPREPRQRHRSRLRFHRETDSETGAGSVRDVGARCSVWFPGRAAPDVRWICRQRCCCNLTAPPLCHRADQSQPWTGAWPRSHWTAGLSVTEASVSNLNTEIT